MPKPNAEVSTTFRIFFIVLSFFFKDEDDGVVLAAMVWGRTETNKAGLLILDAKTFKELARAEFHTPSPVPKCLHGWFLSQ